MNRQGFSLGLAHGHSLKIVPDADMFTTTFFAYFLRFWAPKYALRITITELRTRESLDF